MVELALGDEVQVRGRVVEISDLGCEPNELRVTVATDLSVVRAVLHKFVGGVYATRPEPAPSGDAA